jgi:signal transduction histidine kinase
MSESQERSARALAEESSLGLAEAHARFGRAVMFIYLGTALLAIILLLVAVFTDLEHEQEQARSTLSLATQVRAHYVGHHLQLLRNELVRLGLRSEVDLLDENMAPERDLLRLAHEKSTFFNAGTAILDAQGTVIWSEPRTFLALGLPLGREPWFEALHKTRAIQTVPSAAQTGDQSIVFLVSPIVRSGSFTGALLGAVDLETSETVERSKLQPSGAWLAVAMLGGAILFPPAPPAVLSEFVRLDLPRQPTGQPFVTETAHTGERVVVAGAAVQDTSLVLLSVADAGALFGPARTRLITRLVAGLLLSAVPLVPFSLLLRRSLLAFRRSEEGVMRGERQRSLGEAVDLIAHEVKNSLNGMRIGLDMILQGDGGAIAQRHARAATGLRAEMERLSSFTAELLSFSKGVVPRPVPIDLTGTVQKVADLSREAAERQSVVLQIPNGQALVPVRADPGLLHVVIANLVSNALDSLSEADVPAPRVVVTVEADGRQARVRVSDNGPGVSARVKPRLFEPFASGKPSGTGIGLALSRRIARAHGGDLVLEHTTTGASFLLLLPQESA